MGVALKFYAQEAGNFIRISDELVNNEVTSIIQDKNGFIWFGTRGGLQRFDGYEMKLLKSDFTTGNNLLSQSIEVLLNGKQNNIWIGTKSGGLSSFDLKTGIITNYPNNNKTNSGFNADYILSLYDADDEKLLIGTWRGFQYLNKKTGRFTILNSSWKTFDIQADGQNGYWLATNSGLRHLNKQLVNDVTYEFDKPDINITSIVHDKQYNCLWLGTWNEGLIQFHLQTKAFKQYKHEENNPASVSSNNTYRLHLDSKGSLWVATWGAGLNLFNKATDSFEKMDLSIPGLNTSDNRIILTIREDPSGLLWIGTDGAGVFKMDLNQKKFSNIGVKSNALIGSTHIISVYTDPFQKLWLGTKGGGIQYSTDGKTFTQYRINSKQDIADPISSYVSRSFLQDGNYLWVGTNKALMRIVNSGTTLGAFELFLPDRNNPASISDKKINALVKDAEGKIWIGTQEFGLNCITGFDKNNKPIFKKYLHAFGVKGALQNERVSCLLVDSKKRLWVGTYKGLHLYNPSDDSFKVFVQTGDGKTSISNNTILCLTEDKAGNIWAGTQSGLNKISVDSNEQLQVIRYNTRDGLPNDYVHAVLADDKGNIWATTNKGLVRINPVNQSIAVFDKRDGVQSDMFSENASFKDANGQLFFGGLEGLTYFKPDSIRINRFHPPVYFTNLTINNESYEFGKKEGDSTVLSRPFYETKSITLNYKENIFSIGFAALDYHAPDKNEYMYQLEGFHDDWVYAGNNRTVSFTNLKAGTYTLKVKATNSDKIWNDVPHELKIIILPPPWRTWWAYTIYVLLFIFLLWLTRYFGLRQVALKNQLTLSRMSRQQEKKLSDFKERLFTNISHEFRTPLTLILGPLEDLLQRTKVEAPVEKSLRLIQKQSKRLLRMVNQLLDYQKAEAGSLKLILQPGELVTFCNELFLLFKDEAARRNMQYSFHAQEKFISFVFDFNKLEIIVFNVLANAFKFTPDGEAIHMEIIRHADKSCEIKIADTGKGIPENERDKIFDRFYRGKEDDIAAISGSGIGLSFVKELVELHGGTITATYNKPKGTLFTITLPHKELIEKYPTVAEPLQFNQQLQETNLNIEVMSEENEMLNQEQELPIILVVEDETDIQQYVYEILSPSFKVITASNGKDGLSKALEIIPDLIVSDIMMPEMDGIELCRTVKSHKDTSHIPVILLTALSDMAHHVQGIQEGADVYLPKPFNSQLLLVHIHNLINSRNKLKELYAKRILLGTGSFEIKTYEEEFLYKLMKLVEENISNSNFSNDELANLMFMSRSTFYRKLKAVTGMSGNEFIRTARLNFAVKLLESGNYSVTEAAYEAGFNDIKYFRKRFQDQFGVSPSDYKK
ncbi:hybrid sensor histidine kinase/response regulator [Lacibacter luteus]|uniref:histidine kinase n=1 Tax=Lacibacter luteus TaxID=2508719 RepID=A0A4Q1CKY4_9BACT|nr:two-component regulator propeller domain-containing protein [Lacibacter luteus]RXK61633.1 hybrid sensor histidine kinase/response regulator [Lacibacter luteus]